MFSKLKGLMSVKANIKSTGGVSEDRVLGIEHELDLVLGEEMKDYLRVFGSIYYRNIEFGGAGKQVDTCLDICLRTQELRNENELFPKNTVFFESLADGHVAICSDKDDVFEWIFPNPDGRLFLISSSLEDYIVSRINKFDNN